MCFFVGLFFDSGGGVQISSLACALGIQIGGVIYMAITMTGAPKQIAIAAYVANDAASMSDHLDRARVVGRRVGVTSRTTSLGSPFLSARHTGTPCAPGAD